MLGEVIMQIRRRSPLVHCITNYVTANDCANLLLGCGASAIMADDPLEAAEISAMCDGLVLNMGTPNLRKLKALIIAGRRANQLNHPIVFDPVGVGSSRMRRYAAKLLMKKLRISAIRANASETAVLACNASARRGVDADSKQADALTIESNARNLANKTGAIVIVSGDTDIVTDGKRLFRVYNGHPIMKTITGTGCQLSALTGACMAANPDRPLEAALAAVCAMGLAGETAFERLSPVEGNASCRNYIIDAIFNMTPEALEKGAKYETDK